MTYDKEKAKKYNREYYRTHKELVKEINRKYREKNKEKIQQSSREYYQKNKDQNKVKRDAHRKKLRERYAYE